MSHDDPLDTEGHERSKAEAARLAKFARDTEEADFKWFMGSKRGRRIVWRSLERAGVFRLSFNTNSMAMAFAEGNRNEGLRTLMQIHALCPELYHVMVKEQVNDRRDIDDDRRNDP